MKVVVAYSGGKDSQASLIWAVNKYGKKNVEAVFCDTNWESMETYQAIDRTITKLGVKYHDLHSTKYDGLVDLAKKRGRFPSVKARFCTSELKTKPMIDYILAQKESLLIIQGIRADESESRSKMDKQCRFFRYYFEHIGNTGRYYNYRKSEVKKWCEKYADDIWRPVFNFTAQEVIDFILSNGLNPNPLYKKGMSRVGCFPCILTGVNELAVFIEQFPERFEEIIDLEEELNSSFFKIDLIPERYQTGYDDKSGKKFTRAVDVKKYLQHRDATIDMFPDEKIKCSSHYGLCD